MRDRGDRPSARLAQRAEGPRASERGLPRRLRWLELTHLDNERTEAEESERGEGDESFGRPEKRASERQLVSCSRAR